MRLWRVTVYIFMAPIDELLDVLHREAGQARFDDRLHDAIALLNNIRHPQTDVQAATSPESATSAEEQFSHLLLQLLDEGELEAAQKVKEIVEKLGEEFLSLRSAIAHHIPSKSRNTLSNEAHSGDIEEELQSKVSIVMPPQPSKDFPSLPWRDDSGRFNDLNDIYFLHTLSNSPEMLVPPGKSLRSVLSGSQAAAALGDASDASGSSLPSFQQKVEEIAKQAFWDEAKESLSDPTSGKQLARLKSLHSDLREKLDGLISAKHPLMIMLSSPLSPSSNPLLSGIRHLEMVTSALKTLCAPVRDELLDSALALLSDEGKSREERVAYSFKQIFHISDLMRQDMTNILLNSVSDEDLHWELVRQARSREIRAILELWSLESVRSSWDSWCHDPSGLRDGDVRWIRKLVDALGSDSPVHCVSPESEESNSSTSQSDTIPPPFLFACPSLHRIQNHLQAVTIAATLRTLVPHLGRNIQSPDSIVRSDSSFTERVLSLLMIEVNEEEDSGTIKLTNLADEVVREHHRLAEASTLENNRANSSMDDASLRAAVNKLVRPADPVYALLRRRLLESLVSQVSSALRRAQQNAPGVMQTGREAKRLKPDPALALDLRRDKKDVSLGQLKVDAFHVKGYEEEVLSKNILDVTNSICKVVEWVRNGWSDLISLE